MSESRKLRVFLCHASQDKPVVRELYARLAGEAWIDPWLDEEKLLPGQSWHLEIQKSVESADAVIVCLSNRSVTKEGYIQKELRKILDIALEKPEATIFILPLRLDDCEIPSRLLDRQYVNYFPLERREQTYQRLLQSLQIRFDQLQPLKNGRESSHQPANPLPVTGIEEQLSQKGWQKRMVDLLFEKGSGIVDIGGSIPLILFFLLAALSFLTPSDSTNQALLGVFGILAGIMLAIRRQIPATILFRIFTIVYLVLHGLNELADLDAAMIVEGFIALLLCGICVVTVRIPKKPLLYSSLSMTLVLLMTAGKEVSGSFDYYPSFIDAPITVLSIITAILLLGDL